MTNKIRQQILEVREDGRTNMFDVNGVMYVANDLNLFDLVVFLDDRDNRREYTHFIMTGEAEITDEDEAPDEEEEDDPILPTSEEQKAEAIKCLKILFEDESIVEEFEKNGTVFMCNFPDGNMILAPDDTRWEINWLEKKHNAIVYLIIRNSWSDSLFYISKYKEDWDLVREELGQGYPIVYVVNREAPECSEFGTIRIAPAKGGGYVRLG